MNEDVTLTALTNRVFHGAHHMPVRDLAARLAVLALGIAVTLWVLVGDTPAGAVVPLFMTMICSMISALELHTAGLICELSDDGDQDGTDEFGTAA